MFGDYVVKALPIYGQKKFLVLVKSANNLKIYDSLGSKIEHTISLPKKFCLHSTMIMDFVVSDSKHLVAALNSERRFFFWSYNNIITPLLVGEMDVLMKKIYRLESLDLWVTAGETVGDVPEPVIKLWKFTGERLVENKMIITHNKPLTAIFYVA